MMSQVRFISDLHFGHKNLAQELRKFQDEFYHDEYIIDSWNNVVNKKDITYILGDITMETSKHYYLLDRLLGRKIVILGNHDNYKHSKELLKYVDGIAGISKYSSKQFGKFILTHCPIHTFELDLYESKGKFYKNIHGHIHTNKIDDSRYINVSAEMIDYTPKTLEELLNYGKI